MSTTNPKSSNGKQSATGSSLCTPSGTPVNTIATNTGSNSVAQNSPPPCANAPKYGTLVPNRIFVGGIASNTTEAELLQLFTVYGTVKAAKIIQDRAGVSKGYGFVTFDNEQDAHRAMRDADNIVLRERKLNIAPAIKKQPFSRVFGESTSPSLPTGSPSYYITPGTVPYYQGGVTYFSQAPPQTPGESATPQATMYQPPQVFPTQTGPPQQPAFQSVMFPAQPMYMPQFLPMYDYNYYATGSGSMGASGGQYMVGGGSGGGGAGGQGAPPLQPPPTAASPPRPPAGCYGAGQQLGAYGAPPPHDSMYYAMPALYGPPMDAATAAAAGPGAIYATECIELPNSGYGEQETPYTSLTPLDIHHHHHHHQNHPSENGLDSTTAVLPSVSLAQRPDSNPSLERQSNTPVVSLLNIDHHQEKDYTSMQSGRRRKSTTSSVVPPSISPYLNGYNNNNNNNGTGTVNNKTTNPYGGYNPGVYNAQAYPPCTTMYNYNGGATPLQLAPPSTPVSAAASYLPDPVHYRFRGPVMNGFMYAPHKKRRYYNNNNNNGNDRRPPMDQSRRSSIRSNSNSSASVGDDPKDERGFTGGSVCLGVQALNHSYCNYGGYSTGTGTGTGRVINGSRNGSGYGGYRNNYNNYNGTGTRIVYGSNNNNNYTDRKTGGSRGGSVKSGGGSSVVVVESGKVGSSSNSEKSSGTGSSGTGTGTGTNTGTVTKDNSVERDDNGLEKKVSVNGPVVQVHPSGGTGNPSFLPPRRARRTMRRSAAGGSSLSEIGAGDAPLPQDLSDACKKMEGLKL